MRFNLYNRFHLEILRRHDAWIAYRSEHGTRVPVEDLIIPPDLEAANLATYLDDVYHELAGFGDEVERIPDDVN